MADSVITSAESSIGARGERCVVQASARRAASEIRGDWGTALVWGDLEGCTVDWLGSRLAAGEAPAAVLANARGYFALFIRTPGVVIAAVDRLSSRPLLVRRLPDETVEIGIRLSDFPNRANCIDERAALQLAMGGQTIGCRTIVKDIMRLPAGHYLVVPADGPVTMQSFWRFQPWERAAEPVAGTLRAAQNVLLAVAENLHRRAGDRPIVVPLSAGMDSRTIVSSLHHVGRRNLICFSYGLPGNHEAVAARDIAEQLGYRWIFIPYSVAEGRHYFETGLWHRFSNFAATGAATPFNADVLALDALLSREPGLREGIFVNGQSGDYITGMHIPDSLDDNASWDAIIKTTIQKHFSLWQSLLTQEFQATIAEDLRADWAALGAPVTTEGWATALYESSEYYNRQAKYVVGGQRAYEFFGLDWDLPLWREEIVDFFGSLPLSHKRNQMLYVTALAEANWGGVWSPLRHPRWVTPRWLNLLRWPAKVACAPFGQQRWKQVDRRLFAYWMDLVCNYPSASYRDVLFDRHGHRNAISWVCRRHLAELDPVMAGKLFSP